MAYNNSQITQPIDWIGKVAFAGAMAPYIGMVTFGAFLATTGANAEERLFHDSLIVAGLALVLFGLALGFFEFIGQLDNQELRRDVIRVQNGLAPQSHQLTNPNNASSAMDSKRILPQDGGETPSPEFLETLFGATDGGNIHNDIPSVRSEVWKAIGYNPQRVQAMLTRLVTWKAIEGRTEAGASGHIAIGWTHARCRGMMTSEQPDYALILPKTKE